MIADTVFQPTSCHFDTLAKHMPVKSKKYTALFSIGEIENKFQDCQKKKSIFGIFVTPFPVDISTLPATFQMECKELQSDIQLKNLLMSLYQTFISSLLVEKKNIHCFTVAYYSCHHFWQYVHL